MTAAMLSRCLKLGLEALINHCEPLNYTECYRYTYQVYKVSSTNSASCVSFSHDVACVSRFDCSLIARMHVFRLQLSSCLRRQRTQILLKIVLQLLVPARPSTQKPRAVAAPRVVVGDDSCGCDVYMHPWGSLVRGFLHPLSRSSP